MNRTLIALLSVLLALGAAAVGGYFLVRETKEIATPMLFPQSSGARQLMSMDDFRFVQSEGGKITWRMDAKKADLYENKEAQLEEIEVNFHNPDKREAKLYGDTGTMDTTSGNASIHRVTHDVKIITSDDYLLTTASLFWKAGERIVRTSDPFKLIGEKIYLEGVGITANIDLGTIVVKENVKAVLQE